MSRAALAALLTGSLLAGCTNGSSATPAARDLATAPIVAGGGDLGAGPRTCDERIRAGALGDRVLLSISTPADDTDLAVHPNGTSLAFLSGGSLMLAPIDAADPHKVGPASAVTIGGGLTLAGGSFTGDGAYWFAASSGGSSQIYRATLAANVATVGVSHFPSTPCAAPLASPLFVAADETAELFVVGPLAGCAGGSYLASGAIDLHLGAFAAAVVAPGARHPSLLPGDRTLVFSTGGAFGPLVFVARGSTDAQFGGVQQPARPIDAAQLVVDPTCRVAYLAAGSDLYVADITP